MQDVLEETTILDYTVQVRQQILKEIGVSTLNFMEYRSFAKRHLALMLKDFRKNDFQASPASLIMTNEECLDVYKRQLMYREIFEEFYPGYEDWILDFWMPNRDWVGAEVTDPSARVLSNYGDSGK